MADDYTLTPVPLIPGRQPQPQPWVKDKGMARSVALFVDAVRVGVPIERAITGSGMSLQQFAALLEEHPELRGMIAEARGALETRLFGAMCDAAAQGKHMAASWVLERQRPVDAEIDSVILLAKAGSDEELEDEEIRKLTDSYFAEEDER
jgi:hypothetical protein